MKTSHLRRYFLLLISLNAISISILTVLHFNDLLVTDNLLNSPSYTDIENPNITRIRILFWTPFHVAPHAEYAMSLDEHRMCVFTSNKKQLLKSNIVVFYFHTDAWSKVLMKKERVIPPIHLSNQRWIYYHREPPTLVNELRHDLVLAFENNFNTIATHMADSDIWLPYGSYRALSESEKADMQLKSNYAAGRTKLAYAMISNCGASSGNYFENGRLSFLLEMKEHIPIDIYGRCGDIASPSYCQGLCNPQWERCFQELGSQYKFVFALENSECDDYITEKYWRNALAFGIVPVVRGQRNHYERLAIPGSYVHADHFNSTKQLAEHLLLLDKNEDLYNEYFAWKKSYHVTIHWSNCNENNIVQDSAFCRYAHESHQLPLERRNVSEFVNRSRRCA